MRINNATEMYNLLNTFGLVDKNSKTKEFSNCLLSIQIVRVPVETTN